MAIPKYDELYRDYLNALADGKPHSISEIREIISDARNLNEEDLQQMLPSGRVTVFMNRVSWAGFYLKKSRPDYPCCQRAICHYAGRQKVANSD